MRKILIVVGSGVQKGNTNQLAQTFEKGAKEAGHDVQRIVLSENIQGCQGCGACQKNSHQCVIQDSMQNYYALFEWADTIVLASPLYFWSISGRLKCFIDRLYAISQDDQYPYKETVLLMSAGDNHFWTFEQALSFYSFYTKALGWKDLGHVLAGGCESEPRYIPTQKLQEAYQKGLHL